MQLRHSAVTDGGARSATSATPVRRPSLLRLGTEPLRAAIELTPHVIAALNAPGAGHGHPVVIFPGAGAGLLSTLLKHSRRLGFNAFDRGQGVKRDPQADFDTYIRCLADRTVDLLASYLQAKTLIGWSLGGISAREIAKLIAPRVQQVITIGTPFNADALYKNVGWLFRLLNGSKTNIDPLLARRLRMAPPVPATSIYSRSNGIVAWQTGCHSERRDHVQDIAIAGSHLDMDWNHAVLNVVTDRLLRSSTQ